MTMLRLIDRARPALGLLLLLPLSPIGFSPALAQVTTQPGFETTELLDLAGDRVYGTLSDGGYVSFDGLAFERYDAAGAWVETYDTLPAFVFPSFLEVHPSELFAICGESSNGDLFTIDLVAGSVTPLVNLVYNYDLAWDSDPAYAYVSASLGGWAAGNDVLRVEIASGQYTEVAYAVGPSGPIAVDGDGNLYYVTQFEGTAWPPPLGEEHLLMWSDAQLDAGVQLTEADATYLTAGLDGGSSMLHDPHSGYLFLAHTNHQGLAHEVLAIATDGTVVDTLAECYTWIAGLEVDHDGGPATCFAQQPTNALLRVQNTDFGGSTRDRVTLEPMRAQASYSGPAAGAPGDATVTISGAEPDSKVVLLISRATDLLPSELVLPLGWGAPTFFAAPPERVLRRTAALPTDSLGEADFTYWQSPSMEGALLFQALLYDGAGAPLGTSTWVVNQ